MDETNSVQQTGRKIGWWAYWLGWLPLGVVYSILMSMTRQMTAGQAALQGFGYIVPVAFLGLSVWWLSGKLTRTKPAGIGRAVAAHIVLGTLFTLVWLGIEVGLIALHDGLGPALSIASTFAGFQALDGILLYLGLAAGSHAIRFATRLREQESRAARADALRMRAELAALRGQLNPHFLFNTLHTLTALVRRDPDTAEQALERFGDMLRYVLDVKRAAREDVALAEEIRFVRDYLALEQLRLGDRLRIVEQLDPDALDCQLPSLTLQPIIENAIKHGVAPRARGGAITITAQLDEDMLILEVRDDGAGTTKGVVDAASGMGLRVVQQRLATRYAADARLSITTAPGEGFVVRVELPALAASALSLGERAVSAPA